MAYGDDFDFGDSSPRVRRQFGDLFDPGDPNPRYESDQYARGSDFGVKPITMQDYAAPKQESPYDKYMSGMKDLYGTHPSLDRYNQFLQSAPRAEDYRPSKWERLAAGLGGMAEGFKSPAKGIATAIGLNRSRYTTAMSDYQDMAKPMAEAATIERQGIADKAKYVMDVNDLMYKQQQLARQSSVDRETAAWHNRTATNQEAATRGNIDYQGKRLLQGDRNFNSLSAYQKAGLQNQRAGLGIQQQNADTAARNEANNFYRTMNPPQRPITAADIGRAESDVMSDMAGEHPELIDVALNGNITLKAAPPVNTPEYQRWQQGKAELERRVQQRARGQFNLGAGPNFGGGGGFGEFHDIPDPNDYGDYTDLGEEQ